MSGNRAANQILTIIVIGLVAVFILRFVACGAGVANVAVNGPTEPTSSEYYQDDYAAERQEPADVETERVVGAYYPEADANEPGFLATADPVVLAGVGGAATFGAVGAIALLLFGFGRKNEAPQPATAGDSAPAYVTSSSAAATTAEPQFDEWGRPADWQDAPSQGMPQGCIWAIGIGLFLVILIGPLPLAFFIGLLLDG